MVYPHVNKHRYAERGPVLIPTRRSVAGSKTYILRSTLPADLLEAMSEPNPLPLFQPDEDERDHPSYDDGDGPADSGALINWEKGDGTGTGHVAMMGVRTLILCLVLCAGRVIQDGESGVVDFGLGTLAWALWLGLRLQGVEACSTASGTIPS